MPKYASMCSHQKRFSKMQDYWPLIRLIVTATKINELHFITEINFRLKIESVIHKNYLKLLKYLKQSFFIKLVIVNI